MVSRGHRSTAVATVVVFLLVQVLAGIGVLVAVLLIFLLGRRYRRRPARDGWLAACPGPG